MRQRQRQLEIAGKDNFESKDNRNSNEPDSKSNEPSRSLIKPTRFKMLVTSSIAFITTVVILKRGGNNSLEATITARPLPNSSKKTPTDIYTTSNSSNLEHSNPKTSHFESGASLNSLNPGEFIPRLHIVFSTDCSSYQDWQSYLLFHSAMKVKQPGKVTRIASGCTDEQSIELKDRHDTTISSKMSIDFGLHLTPKFETAGGENNHKAYYFYNKPFGVKHWLEYGEGMGLTENGQMQNKDVIVIILDPDMVLLRPIGIDYADKSDVLVGPNHNKEDRRFKVAHGSPFSQKYGLGRQWQKFNLTYITGDDSTPAAQVSQNDGRDHYPAGPPILATAQDMHKITTKWTEFLPRLREEYPHLLGEMYAYCVAAAHLGLKHQMIDSLMISGADNPGEGWPLINKIPSEEICKVGNSTGTGHRHGYDLPNVIHYCQHYGIGTDNEWFFSKRRLDRNIFSCKKELLKTPPADLALKYDYLALHKKPEKAKLMNNQISFVICALVASVNEAATFFKNNHCKSQNER